MIQKREEVRVFSQWCLLSYPPSYLASKSETALLIAAASFSDFQYFMFLLDMSDVEEARTSLL